MLRRWWWPKQVQDVTDCTRHTKATLPLSWNEKKLPEKEAKESKKPKLKTKGFVELMQGFTKLLLPGREVASHSFDRLPQSQIIHLVAAPSWLSVYDTRTADLRYKTPPYSDRIWGQCWFWMLECEISFVTTKPQNLFFFYKCLIFLSCHTDWQTTENEIN